MLCVCFSVAEALNGSNEAFAINKMILLKSILYILSLKQKKKKSIFWMNWELCENEWMNYYCRNILLNEGVEWFGIDPFMLIFPIRSILFNFIKQIKSKEKEKPFRLQYCVFSWLDHIAMCPLPTGIIKYTHALIHVRQLLLLHLGNVCIGKSAINFDELCAMGR